jgi:hypothetical protein
MSPHDPWRPQDIGDELMGRGTREDPSAEGLEGLHLLLGDKYDHVYIVNWPTVRGGVIRVLWPMRSEAMDDDA